MKIDTGRTVPEWDAMPLRQDGLPMDHVEPEQVSTTATMRVGTFIIPTQSDTPARKAKRRRIKLRALAYRLERLGKYAGVSLLTVLVVVPDARMAILILGANLLLIGIAIGCSLRWRVS